MTLLLALARAPPASRSAAARCSRGDADQRDRGPRGAAHRPPRAARRARSSSTATTSCPTCTRSSTAWRRFALTGPHAASGRASPAPHPQRRQHRHRRLGPRPRDGHRGAAPLQRPVHALPLRVQRRRHGHPRRDHRPRPGRDAVRRRVQDVHHARDADQRPHGARLAASPRSGDEAAVARHFVAVSTNAEKVARVRHRHRRTCSGSGTGSAAATRWTPRSACR